MQHTLQLTKWEWFKVRRLRMPWILLAIAVLVSQLGVWVNYLAFHNDDVNILMSGGFSSYSVAWDEPTPGSYTITCSDFVNDRMPPGLDQIPEDRRAELLKEIEAWRTEGVCDRFASRKQLRRGFTLPNSITQSIAIISSFRPIAIGPILIMILAASIVGSEYGYGTLRTVLAGGIGRWKFLFAKMLLLIRMSSDALIVITLVTVASSLAIALISTDDSGGIADSGKWSEVVLIFLKTVYGLLPFISLGVFATVLTTSRGVGITLSVGYFIVESILATLLRLNETLADVADYLLIQAFLSWTTIPSELNSSQALGVFLAILGYTVILVAATAWVFKQRDIAGATGD